MSAPNPAPPLEAKDLLLALKTVNEILSGSHDYESMVVNPFDSKLDQFTVSQLVRHAIK